MVRSKGPNILFLMETKLLVNEMIPIRDELGYRSMLAVPSVRRSGGLALLWKDDVTINTQTYYLNHIDAKIMVSPQVEGHLTGVYGHLKDQRNKETWALLWHLHSRASMPWVCIGDFNEILSSDEKSGGVPKPLGPMQDIWSTLLHCDLVDLGYQGYKYTWRNGRRVSMFVEERLDRACANSKWRDMFPTTKVRHLMASYSDHDPILLEIVFTQSRHRRRRIQWFEEKWVSHGECEDQIRRLWT